MYPHQWTKLYTSDKDYIFINGYFVEEVHQHDESPEFSIVYFSDGTEVEVLDTPEEVLKKIGIIL